MIRYVVSAMQDGEKRYFEWYNDGNTTKKAIKSEIVPSILYNLEEAVEIFTGIANKEAYSNIVFSNIDIP